MRHALLAQALADVFQHEAEADVDWAKRDHVFARQNPGIGVRQ
jgi:hypothetical protein